MQCIFGERKRSNIRTRATDGTHARAEVECKIELTFVKLGARITVYAEVKWNQRIIGERERANLVVWTGGFFYIYNIYICIRRALHIP